MSKTSLDYYVDNRVTESMIESYSAMSNDKVCDMLKNFVEKSIVEYL